MGNLYATDATLPTYIANNLLPLHLHTRIHAIHNYRESTYVKREDELSATIVGSKYRKYASIIPFVQKNYDEVVVIGGENSNNVVGILQLLNENNITATPFLLKQNNPQPRGNALWLRLLCDEKNIQWIERHDWPQVEKMAAAYSKKNERTLVLPEGGNHYSALWGAMTLAFDIVQNEKDHELYFRDIFIDSGTGMTSIAMILGFAAQGHNERKFHITMIAGNRQEYLNLLQKHTEHIKDKLSCTIDENSIIFHDPPTAKSFGAVNATVLSEVKTIARITGLLVDPVYSAKHFLTAKGVSTAQSPALLIFNGSGFGLAGFQQRLCNYL
ncbi:hypothetical protein [Candidatus Uabimicrobium amorphum]|uniref:hypothetical protein n=1 Tax=Uabimicrobium amorphum TaxID=2596890 RepID=UPI00125F346E|nr:hypothetical protein [Candidatus Uabimicrobium amorphum]